MDDSIIKFRKIWAKFGICPIQTKETVISLVDVDGLFSGSRIDEVAINSIRMSGVVIVSSRLIDPTFGKKQNEDLEMLSKDHPQTIFLVSQNCGCGGSTKLHFNDHNPNASAYFSGPASVYMNGKAVAETQR